MSSRLFRPLDLNIEKCMKLAIIHEIGEIYAGDFIPNQIDKSEKHKLEEASLDTLLKDINFNNDFKKLWLEFENQESPEAKFIREVDILECVLQSGSYNLNSKCIKRASQITIPCLKEILEDVNDLTKNNIMPKIN